MKTLGLFLLAAALCPAAAAAQSVTVTAPAATVSLKAADDFATRAFQDPWDMNQRTDLGWFLHGTDQPESGFTSVDFANGQFVGTSSSQTNVFLLETGNPNAAKLGKIGLNYPINAATYPIIAFRMSVDAPSNVQLVWNRETIYDNTGTNGHNVPTSAGYRTYVVDIRTLATVGLAGNPVPWSGTIKSLTMNTSTSNAGTIRLDWVRLVSVDPALCQTITWNPQGTAVDIYLLDANNGNANLGPIALGVNSTQASAGCTAGAAGYRFYTGALPAGTYRIAAVTAGASPSTLTPSAGAWVVNDAPTLAFTSPSEEGSADDFATTFLNDPWDMDKVADFDLLQHVTAPAITTMNLETPAGVSLAGSRVFRATSVHKNDSGTAVGDPYVDPLFVTGRGSTNRIDTERYRILTFEFGIPDKPRNILTGSIARIVWRVAGVSGESVSDDIIFNHRAGANVLNKVIADMADRDVMKIEQGAFMDGQGWINGSSAQPGLDIFRVDPHEFDDPTDFFIKRIKLAALERASDSYTVRWTYSKSAGTVDLYYSVSRPTTCSSGNPIVAGVSAAAGQYVWDTRSLATAGGASSTYYICAVFTDGVNQNEAHAKWPVVLDSTYVELPRIVVNRSTLNFGVAQATQVKTAAQTVRVTVVGSGSPCWTVDNPLPSIFTVTNGSGCGNGSFTVSLVNQHYVTLGVGEATLTVREVTADTIANSPQTVHAWFRIHGATAAPVGTIDSPADNVTVSGSIAVTGWVVDDVDITSVEIWRAEGASEARVGSAVRVDDARSDVEFAQPDAPFNYRAGWGYLMLTNFLPGGGDGTYVLRVYAIDREGHRALLGTRTIVGANSQATEPFGAIDTPGQGETISGSVNNFGWVLTRGPYSASPLDGGTVTVFIDNVAVGAPGGWTARQDLTSLFPASTYPGVSRAAGVYTFDTTTYANGVHTIAWGVTDNNGQSAGVGSRYFTIVNGSGSGDAPAAAAHLGRRSRDLIAVDAANAVRVRHGYGLRRPSAAVAPDATGSRTIFGRAMQPLAIDASAPGTQRYAAYLVTGGVLKPIPVGASFDERSGVLYWQPGLGFTGSYEFVVVRDGTTRVPVTVVLGPSTMRASSGRRSRALFSSTF